MAVERGEGRRQRKRKTAKRYVSFLVELAFMPFLNNIHFARFVTKEKSIEGQETAREEGT